MKILKKQIEYLESKGYTINICEPNSSNDFTDFKIINLFPRETNEEIFVQLKTAIDREKGFTGGLSSWGNLPQKEEFVNKELIEFGKQR